MCVCACVSFKSTRFLFYYFWAIFFLILTAFQSYFVCSYLFRILFHICDAYAGALLVRRRAVELYPCQAFRRPDRYFAFYYCCFTLLLIRFYLFMFFTCKYFFSVFCLFYVTVKSIKMYLQPKQYANTPTRTHMLASAITMPTVSTRGIKCLSTTVGAEFLTFRLERPRAAAQVVTGSDVRLWPCGRALCLSQTNFLKATFV